MKLKRRVRRKTTAFLRGLSPVLFLPLEHPGGKGTAKRKSHSSRMNKHDKGY